MNKNKIFLAASALVLVAAGAIAGKANAKARPASLYYTNGTGSGCHLLMTSVNTAPSTLLTTAGSGSAVRIITSNSTTRTLYATSGCTNTPVFTTF
jgi:hypothetical protein